MVSQRTKWTYDYLFDIDFSSERWSIEAHIRWQNRCKMATIKDMRECRKLYICGRAGELYRISYTEF